MKNLFFAIALIFVVGSYAQPEIKLVGKPTGPGSSNGFYGGLKIIADTIAPKLYGYVNPQGSWAIPPTLNNGYSFSNGVSASVLKNSKWGVIDNTGKELTGFIFKRCVPSNDWFIATEDSITWKVLDNKGKVLFEQDADLYYVGYNRWVVAKDKQTNLWGFKNIDTKKWTIEPKFNSSPGTFVDGYAVVINNNPTKKWLKYFIIDTKGNAVADTAYNISNRQEGIFKFEFVKDTNYKPYSASNGYYPPTNKLFMNANMQPVFTPEKYTDDYNSFFNGVAAFKDSLGKKYEIITKNGKVIGSGGSDHASVLKNGTAVTIKDGTMRLFDKTGKDVAKPLKGGFTSVAVGDGEYIVAEKSAGGVLVDKSGKEISGYRYSNLGDLSEGLMAAKENSSGYYGFINEKGEWVIKPTYYYEVKNFSGGLAPVKTSSYGGWKIINKEGKLVWGGAEYTDANAATEGLMLLKIKTGSYSSEYKFFDLNGTEKLDMKEYSFVFPFYDGLASVEKNYKWGFVDKTGKLVIDCKFSTTGNFSNGLAWVKENNLYGFIDKTGNMVIPAKYNSLSNFSDDGITFVKLNDKYGYINKQGEAITGFDYTQANKFSSGIAVAIKDNKLIFLNTKGKPAFEHEYIQATDFVNGLALARKKEDKKDVYRLIDTKGKELSEAIYTASIKKVGNNVQLTTAAATHFIYKNPVFKR